MCPALKQGTKRLDVYLTEEDERRFREKVFERMGMKKGNLSSAAAEAIIFWINSDEETIKKKTKGHI